MSWLGWLIKSDQEAAVVPSRADRWLSDCEVVTVACPTVRPDVPRVSILKNTNGLDEKDAHGFMVKSFKSKSVYTSLGQDAASADEKVVYLLVGGAYLLEHSLSTHTIFSLAKLTRGRVFSVNYRKSLSASSAFPGALLDALAGYQYLVDQLGFLPKDIILTGDSAGANLCLALIRYLDELGTLETIPNWGMPAGIFLNSPWADLSGSTPSVNKLSRSSVLIKLVGRGIQVFHTSRFPDWRLNPYFCPALCGYELFDNLARKNVKAYISAGGAEPLLDEIVLLRDSMKKRGMDVMYREIPNGTHSGFAEYQRKKGESYEAAWKVVEADFRAFIDAL